MIYTKQNCFHVLVYVSSESNLNDGSKKLIPAYNHMIYVCTKEDEQHGSGEPSFVGRSLASI
jgi:hypothetical protein